MCFIYYRRGKIGQRLGSLIEDDFQLLKDSTIIWFRSVRHRTDTKIRAYAFCCVVSMTLMHLMQWKAGQARYKMSPHVLKEEMAEIEEIVMIYSPTDAKRKIYRLKALFRINFGKSSN